MYGDPAQLAARHLAFIANQGKVWLCGACAKPRDITPEQLADERNSSSDIARLKVSISTWACWPLGETRSTLA